MIPILFFTILTAVVLLSLVTHPGTDSPEYSDEEFLAAVPDVPAEKALRIRAILCDQLDIPIECLHPSQRFVEDLGCG